MNLSDFDPNQIKDDGARQAIIYLLNLVDRQQAEIERLRAENERQQAELNRLKEQPKRPKPKPAPANAEKKKASPNYSSEADRKRDTRRQKRAKQAGIAVDRAETLRVEQSSFVKRQLGKVDPFVGDRTTDAHGQYQSRC